MNRREAIEKTALVLGYAISGPALAGLLQGCKPSPELNYKPVFFTKDQAITIGEMTEIIIPRTDTPGAKDVGVPSFVDIMLREVYSKTDQEKFISGLELIEKEATQSFGNTFGKCDPNQQSELFGKYHSAALSDQPDSGTRYFIRTLKELTLLGFFTSEPGATQVLQYSPAPGPYQGCLPLSQVGKTWAT
jgi:gluconate 2-dehydrogenase gamma chain